VNYIFFCFNFGDFGIFSVLYELFTFFFGGQPLPGSEARPTKIWHLYYPCSALFGWWSGPQVLPFEVGDALRFLDILFSFFLY